MYSDDTEVEGSPPEATEKYKVDSKEDINVPAGTFSCWKIIMYNGDGNITGTMWYSDQVKSLVKQMDAAGNTMMELKSYTLH